MSSSMLLLENEREADATLQDALAFIDAFEDETETPGASSEKRAKRYKRPHRERVKSEIERLRNDAEALEATLARMKQTSGNHSRRKIQVVGHGSPSTTAQFDSHSVNASHATTDGWMEIVVDEYRRRRQAEATNEHLKRLLAKQTKTIQASQAALAFQFTKEDMNVLYGSQQAMAQYEGIAPEQSLTARVQQLFLDVDHMLVRTGLRSTNSLLSRSQRKVDSNLGVYYEATGCAPVPSSLEYTNQALWKMVMGKTEAKGDEFDERHSKSFTIDFNQQTYEVRSKATMRSRVESERVIYIWSSLTTLPSQHWTFIEDSIIVLRKADPLSIGSLIQSWYRVNVKENGLPSLLDPFKESIMSSLSTRVQSHLVEFSNAMSHSTAIAGC